MEESITSGTVATFIVVPIILSALIATFVILRRYRAKFIARAQGRFSKSDAEYDLSDAKFVGFFSWVAAAVIPVVLALTWWGMYPWKHEYHHWVPKSGVVATADSRTIATGDGAMETKFVVRFQNDVQQYGVYDTRAAGVQPGDTLTITCVRIYQWTGTHGFDCNFVDLVPAGR